MSNEEIKRALFEAFSAGNVRVNNEVPKESLKERFEAWYTKHSHNVSDSKRSIKARSSNDGSMYITFIGGPATTQREANYKKLALLPAIDSKVFLPLGRRSYWHEYGCKANVDTPQHTGNCRCNGKHPNGTYDHDIDCPALPQTELGRQDCICIARRAAQYDHDSSIK